MYEGVLPLQELCLEEIAQLCKNAYWEENLPIGYNPFYQMPSVIIDDLIVRASRGSFSERLESSYLKLLLLSGQVKNFILEDVSVTAEDLQEIFLDLSTACHKLIRIVIKDVYINIVHRMNIHMQKHALNILLSEARNLKSVISCMEFDLEALSNCTQLEKLVLDFPVIKNNIFDFLEVNGQLRQNNSLKYLSAFEDPRHDISSLDMAVILKYCSELTEISCDISKSLEYLHSEELYDGSLTSKYKIRKCYLGSINSKDSVATKDGVYIAALTCPDINDVCMLVNDDQAIYALTEFRNLSQLVVQWEKMEFGDFSLGMQLVLQKPEIGHKLTSLIIVNFSNIDFSCIGMCCPNLEVLKVEYDFEINQNEFLPTSFKKLKHLSVENVDEIGCQSDTLIGILSNTTELNFLSVMCAERLTDSVLNEILKRNKLSNLNHLQLSRCTLSMYGIQNFVSSLTALEFFDLSRTSLDIDEVASVVHDINPRVIVSSSLV